MIVKADSTDVTTYFVLRKAADGTELTGATITDMDLQYTRSGVAPSAKVDATALAATDSAHADNKAIEIDATDQPGLYRVDWPDAAFATGVRCVILTVKYATALTSHLRVELSPAVTLDPVQAATTFASLTVTGALTAGSIVNNGVFTQTGAVSLASTLGVTGATTLASASITGQLDAGNLLVDTTTALTGAVSTGAITGASLSVTGQLDAGNILVDTTTALTGAVTAPSGITGNITGNITGTLTTVTTATNVTTLNGIANNVITAASIADNAIDAATFAADVDGEIATYIWNAATVTYGGAGTYGQAVEDILVDTGTTLDGKADQLVAACITNAAGVDIAADIIAVKADTAAILVDTGTTLDALIQDIPTVAEFNARSLPSADYTIVGDLGTVQTADHTASIAAIKAITDLLPSGIKKNTALNNFEFYMVLAADHISPAVGKTIVCQRSIDGAAFANCNTVNATEISAGIYKLNLAASDLNGDVITFKFTEATCDTRMITIKTST